MRRHLSVLALWARGTLGWVLAVLAAAAAAEAALFGRVLMGMEEPGSIDDLLAASGVYWVCAIGFLLVMALLICGGCEFQGSRLCYTLRRLSIREEATVLWQAGYNVVCLLLFWAVQAAVMLGLCLWYAGTVDPACVSGQTVFLAFYRIGLLHGLLPLEDTFLYIRNILFLAALGLGAASFPYFRRRGSRGGVVFPVTAWVISTFAETSISLSGYLVISVVAILGPVLDGFRLAQNWEGGVPDEKEPDAEQAD